VKRIRINLVDNTDSVKHLDFRVVPVTSVKEFTCSPDGVLPLRDVVRLSQEVMAGRAFGEMGKYLWYRLKETPASKHKNPTAHRG
jgi:hypothetical protein